MTGEPVDQQQPSGNGFAVRYTIRDVIDRLDRLSEENREMKQVQDRELVPLVARFNQHIDPETGPHADLRARMSKIEMLQYGLIGAIPTAAGIVFALNALGVI